MKIDVIFDAVCPWCYIGKRRFEQAMAQRPHIQVKPHWRPFLLNPDMPTDGIDRSTYLLRKFGSEARVRRTYGAIEDAGQSVEIDFAFDRIKHTPSSVDAHRLVRVADREDLAGEAVEALFRAYFIDGLNIGEQGVLLDIAATLGLDGPRTRKYLESDADIPLIYEENTRAHHMGLNGVPSYVFNGHLTISGAQDPHVLARMLDAAHQMDQAA